VWQPWPAPFVPCVCCMLYVPKMNFTSITSVAYQQLSFPQVMIFALTLAKPGLLPVTSLSGMCRPGFAFNAFSNDAYLEGLAQCVQQGLTQAVGVSNYNAQRTKNAARTLSERGTCLSSNQVGPAYRSNV
jgi:hypothetical protein